MCGRCAIAKNRRLGNPAGRRTTGKTGTDWPCGAAARPRTRPTSSRRCSSGLRASGCVCPGRVIRALMGVFLEPGRTAGVPGRSRSAGPAGHRHGQRGRMVRGLRPRRTPLRRGQGGLRRSNDRAFDRRRHVASAARRRSAVGRGGALARAAGRGSRGSHTGPGVQHRRRAGHGRPGARGGGPQVQDGRDAVAERRPPHGLAGATRAGDHSARGVLGLGGRNRVGPGDALVVERPG